jgi:hypothetical protein
MRKPTAAPKLLIIMANVVARALSFGPNQMQDSCDTGTCTRGAQAALRICPACRNGTAIELK